MASKLPWGAAAVASLACGFGAAVPAMGQVWFVGPVARTTGDIGIFFSLIVSAVFYTLLRSLEIKLSGRI